jgi:uncharacterized membrane protein
MIVAGSSRTVRVTVETVERPLRALECWEASSMAVLESAVGDWIGLIGTAIEIFGVLVIVGGIAWATYAFAQPGWFRVARIEDRGRELTSGRERDSEHYESYKFRIGHSLLLGLEVLVAADTVKTIGLDLTVKSLGVLALLVLIRTFLSWSLTVEIEGCWPWQRGRQEEARTPIDQRPEPISRLAAAS